LIASFFNRTFAALQFPNYRLWFTGQLISLFGTWMQSTAQGFLVYELTGSPAYLGYVGFAAGIPTWLFCWRCDCRSHLTPALIVDHPTR
jgi:hypothetical protein